MKKIILTLLKELVRQTRRIADELNWGNRIKYWEADRATGYNVDPPKFKSTELDKNEKDNNDTATTK